MDGADPSRLRVVAQLDRTAGGWGYAIVYGAPPVILSRSKRVYSSERGAKQAGAREIRRVRANMRLPDLHEPKPVT